MPCEMRVDPSALPTPGGTVASASARGRTEAPVRCPAQRGLRLRHGDRGNAARYLHHPGIDAGAGARGKRPDCRSHGLPHDPARGARRTSCSGTCTGEPDSCRSGARTARDLRPVRAVPPCARPGTGHAGRIAVRPDHVRTSGLWACCCRQRSGATFMTLDI